MGFGGIGIWQLLIILAIVILLFGTKRLSSIGTDLGKAIKGFKNSVKDEDAEAAEKSEEAEHNVENKSEPTKTSTEHTKTEADDKTRQ